MTLSDVISSLLFFIPTRKLTSLVKILVFIFIIYWLYRLAVRREYGSRDQSHVSVESDYCPVPLLKETISANARAETAACKEEIKSVGCLAASNKLTPPTLPQQCPYHSSRTYLGCFIDRDGEDRIFRSRLYQAFSSETNSVVQCVQTCFTLGYTFAGVQYGSECHCSNSMNTAAERAKSQLTCEEYRCPGDRRTFCGGHWRVKVYQTGLNKTITDRGIESLSTQGSDEEAVRLVFVFIVNLRNTRQFKRLLRLIYRPEHYYYIHVDARNNYTFHELLAFNTSANIHVATRRFAPIWGGASLLQVYLQIMRDLTIGPLAWSWHQWNYFINYSEADMPVRTVEELVRFLSANEGTNFLKKHGILPSEFLRKNGFHTVFHECDNHLWKLGKRTLPTGVHLTGASDWFVLHRDFVSYAALDTDDLTRGLKEMYKYSLLPAESFFHNLLLNSKFCGTFVNANLKFSSWGDRNRGCQCQHRNVVDWCGCSPKILELESLERIEGLRANRQTFSARKFDPIVDLKVINEVEKLCAGSRALSSELFLLNVWSMSMDPRKPSLRPLTAFCAITPSGMCADAELLELYALKRVDVQIVNELVITCKCAGYKLEALVRETDPVLSTPVLRLEVGLGYDPKERIFTEHAKLIPLKTDTMVYIEWDISVVLQGAHFSLEIIRPDGSIGIKGDITVNTTLGINTLRLPHDGEKKFDVPGLWKLTVRDKDRVLASRSVLVLDEENEDSERALPDVYSVVGLCTTTEGGSAGLSPCAETPWSSFAPDPVSDFVPSSQM